MKKPMKRRTSIFRINPEYYTFVSGALVSIPLSLMFAIGENYDKCAFWIGLVFSVFSSFFCFKLSILLKDVHEAYASNKKGIVDVIKAWNVAIDGKRGQCIIYLILVVVTLVITVVCIWFMQFPDALLQHLQT